MARTSGRQGNPVKSVTLTITITPLIRQRLEKLARIEGFGRTASEVAGRFVEQETIRLIAQGTFLHLEPPQDQD